MSKYFFISTVFVIVLTILLIFFGVNKKTDFKPFFGDKITNFCVNQICIKQVDNQWWVDDGKQKIPADKSLTETSQKQLGSVVLDNLVSKNKARENEFGFFEKKLIEISVGDKKIELGANGADYASSYIRQPGSNFIYSIPLLLQADQMTNIDYWKNSWVTNLALYQVKSVNDLKPDQEGKWSNVKFIETLVHLKSTTFDPVSYDLNMAKYFEIRLEQGKENLWIGKETKSNNVVFFATTDRKIFYQISKNDFDLLTVGL